MNTVEELKAIIQVDKQENEEERKRLYNVIKKYDKLKKPEKKHEIALSGVSIIIHNHSNFVFTISESNS